MLKPQKPLRQPRLVEQERHVARKVERTVK